MNSSPKRPWCSKYQQTLRSIRLLPVAALIPLLNSVVPLAERNSSFIANLRTHDDQIVMELINDQTQVTSSSYHGALEKLDPHLTQNWKPIAYRKEAAKSIHALAVALNHRCCCCCLPSTEKQPLCSNE